jgi:hypothetical protein
MPKFKKGNIWTSRRQEYSWMAITTNSVIKPDGTLVMGAGIAKEALEYYPGIDKIFGEKISKICKPLGFYGCVAIPNRRILALQTKYNFKDKSTIELVKRSIHRLVDVIDFTKIYNIDFSYQELIVHIPFPGIGYGGLNPKLVYESCLKDLPDNYIFWTKN